MKKKYELTGEVDVFGKKFFRIKALISFGNVTKGASGGLIEKEENLAQYGNAWVYDSAEVSGDAKVSGNAEVSGDARVSGDAEVSGDARVSGDAKVSGNAEVSGDAKVSGDARVSGDAKVSGNAEVSGDAKVYNSAEVSGDARVYDSADVLWITKIGSEKGTLTIFKTKNGFKLVRGCFFGTFEEFKTAVNKKSEDDKSRNEYEALYPLIELRFGKYLR